MKTLNLVIFCACIATFPCLAQIVPSSCNADQSIIDQYQQDAAHLAHDRVYSTQSTYMDSIELPHTVVDTFLNALIAVYNATSIPARDSVVVTYNIHEFSHTLLNGFEVHGDSNTQWMQNIENGISPTGNAALDQLVSLYNFSLTYYSGYSGLFVYHTAVFQSVGHYNINPILSAIQQEPGVVGANQLGVFGDGNSIEASVHNNYVDLTYVYAWGDCPAGCISEHRWNFRVYNDCGVEYLGSSGDPIPSLGIQDPSDSPVKLYPNPAIRTLTIEGIESGIVDYTIVNALGKTVASGSTRNYRLTLNNLPQGSYFLLLDSDGKTIRQPFIKQ